MLSQCIVQKAQPLWSIFKLLFNEDSETIFPREEMLRTSDANSHRKNYEAVHFCDTNDLT